MRGLFRARAARLPLCAAALFACAAAAPGQDNPTTGRVASVTPAGKLRVKQGSKEVPAEATVGMIVRRRYLLYLAPGARATVLCGGSDLREVVPGQWYGVPCVAPAKGTKHGPHEISDPRGGDTARSPFPVVLSPRKTRLLTTRPTIRWSPVRAPAQGAAVTYHVGVFAENMRPALEREVTSRTELEYPADAEALARGAEYKVIVRAAGRSSREEDTPFLGFQTLSEAEAKEVGDAAEAVGRLKLPPAVTQFFVADLYAERGLRAEAIEKLEAVQGALREPAVLRLLGDLYASVGLPREAVARYESALALPQIGSDLEAQALTLASLGRAYLALGEPDEAEARFRKAVEVFARLGEEVEVEELRDGTRESAGQARAAEKRFGPGATRGSRAETFTVMTRRGGGRPGRAGVPRTPQTSTYTSSSRSRGRSRSRKRVRAGRGTRGTR